MPHTCVVMTFVITHTMSHTDMSTLHTCITHTTREKPEFANVKQQALASLGYQLRSSNPVKSKIAIFPETREGNVHSSNKSARCWSLRKAYV